MNEDKFDAEDLKKLLDYYNTSIGNYYINNSFYYNNDYVEEDDSLSSNIWFNTVNFSEWNLDIHSNPGYKKLTNIFTENYITSPLFLCYNNIKTFLEHKCLLLINTKNRVGIRDVGYNTWLIITFDYVLGKLTITLEYLFDGVEEKILCKDFDNVFNIIEEEQLLDKYLNYVNDKLYLLSYVAKDNCKSFLSDLGKISSSVYSMSSPKCGFVFKNSIGKRNNSFELFKRSKDFCKINIPCAIKFCRTYGVDEEYDISSLQDLEIAMYAELTNLLSYEISKKGTEKE